MSKRIIKLSESDIKKHIQNVVSEQSDPSQPIGPNDRDYVDPTSTTVKPVDNKISSKIKPIQPKKGVFDKIEQQSLKQRNFKISVDNTHAVLDRPSPKNVFVVFKDVKSGGFKITRDGRILFVGPHDKCDVELDKIIGYDWRKNDPTTNSQTRKTDGIKQGSNTTKLYEQGTSTKTSQINTQGNFIKGLTIEKDAEEIWKTSKDAFEFEDKMMAKGYSKEDSHYWQKRYIAKDGFSKTNPHHNGPNNYFRTWNDNTADFQQSTIAVLEKYKFSKTNILDTSGSDPDAGKKMYSLKYGQDPNQVIKVVPYLCDKNRIGAKVWDPRSTQPRQICGDATSALETKLEQYIQYFLNANKRASDAWNKLQQSKGNILKNYKQPVNENKKIKNQKTNNMKVRKVVRLRESELKTYIQKIISEQTEQSSYTLPYKVGQVLQGKRSVDGQMYTIKITRVGPEGQKWVMAKIKGPGTYEERPINGKGEYELYSYRPGKISGNDNMGEFTIVKQTNEQIYPDYSKGTHDTDKRGDTYLPLAQKLAKQLLGMKFKFNGKNIFTNTFDGWNVRVEFNNQGVNIHKSLEKNTGMPNMQAPLIIPFEKLTEMNFMKQVVDYVHGTKS
jgi:hypothetical protein